MLGAVSRETSRKRQYWLDHVKQWKLRGLSKMQYCTRPGIKPSNFCYWSSNASKVELEKPTLSKLQENAPIHFLPVNVTPSPLKNSRTCVSN